MRACGPAGVALPTVVFFCGTVELTGPGGVDGAGGGFLLFFRRSRVMLVVKLLTKYEAGLVVDSSTGGDTRIDGACP